MRSLRIFTRASRQCPATARRQCHATLAAAAAARRSFASALVGSRTAAPNSPSLLPGGGEPVTSYFLSNRAFDRSRCLDFLFAASSGGARLTSSAASSATTTTATSQQLPQDQPAARATPLPHRLRQQRKKQQQQQLQQQQQQQHNSDPSPLPPDASSLLTTQAAAQPALSLRRTLSACLSLSKPRLTVLVVLTAVVPYALYPVPEILTTTTTTTILSPLTLLFLTTGTALCSAAANALNMLYEPDTDSKMTRTRNRPLVRRLLAPRTAALFALLAAMTGIAALYTGVNPTVAALGAANITLYAGLYTPLKRLTPLNTWIGALVGAIPPLMGWAAAAGETATLSEPTWRQLLLAPDGSSIGGWLLAALLFAWQFPHFMALSWPIRAEYRAAGLRMLAWTNPARNGRVALRYGALAPIPLCLALCAAGLVDWSFAATSLPVNLWLAREAVRFWRCAGHAGSARGLFWASVWHLPVVLMLAMLHKKDMWRRARRALLGHDGGEGDEDEDGLWEDQEDEEVARSRPSCS